MAIGEGEEREKKKYQQNSRQKVVYFYERGKELKQLCVYMR
jgi:hypothetical protein